MRKTNIELAVAAIVKFGREFFWLEQTPEELAANFLLTVEEAKDVQRRLQIRIDEDDE